MMRLLLAAFCCVWWAVTCFAQTTAVRPSLLGPGLASTPGTYNPGTQVMLPDVPVYLQLFYDPHTTSCTINSTCGSTQDSGKLLTATAGSVTFTLPTAGGAGGAGYSFGYDGNATHTYQINTVGGATIYGGCGLTGTSVGPIAFGVSLVPDAANNWQCTPFGSVQLTANNAWTAGQAATPAALTDAATIAVNAAVANGFTVTLAGNRILGNPTGVLAGQHLEFAITQDGTGSRTLTYGANYKWSGGVAPVLTTTAAATDVLSCWAYITTALACVAVLNVH